MSRTGTITTHESGVDFVVEWQIQGFTTLRKNDGAYYRSPDFCFGGERWYLGIYPNGWNLLKSSGHVGLGLYKCHSGRSIRVSVSLSLKTAKGEMYKEEHGPKDFADDGDNWFHDFNRFIPRPELATLRSDLLPDDVLTVVCTMKKSTSAGSESTRSLSEVYKRMLLDGRHHDLILKVSDKELRAHRDVLRVQSRVFESMLDHDMKEKNTGVIDVPDCDPDTMELFLLYVYCGKIEALDHGNMLGLYYIADKYEMTELKIECCNFIKESLSATNICSVIQLALNHSDSDLLDCATDYFGDNMVDIMQTVEWQSFLKENSTVANELLKKSIKKLKNVQT